MAASSEVPSSQSKPLKPFPHPFIEGEYDVGAEPRTLVELAMMQLSGQIRSKKNWEQKMKDETIVAKWRKECSKHISEKQFNYVMQELKYYESLKENNIEVSAVDGVWQSDELIPQELKQRLIEGVAPLENVPDEEKDWHPGSDNQVLDLIHPSLYCFVHGRSRVLEEGQTVVPTLPSMGKGTPSKKKEVKKKWQKDYAESIDYQWLPAEFHVDTNGKVSIRSYINNLHPVKHRGLYRTIGDIFERFVPLFNKVLTDLLNPRPVRVEVDPYSWYDHLDKEEEEDEELEKKKEEAQNDKEKEEQKEVEDEQERENKRRKTEEGEGEEDNEEEQKEEGGQEEEEEEEDRHPKQPEPPEVFVAPPTPPLEKIVDLRGRNLQVIVKLANIILTPEKPSYPGGSWHVEGMINERIVSSGIYYYASENITESRLAFRQCVREPPYEQDDGVGVQEVFGLVNEEALNQPLGHVITQEDRCIAFPNMYQHQVAPFQLVDPKKPGYRKILVFFLVDPAVRVVSTLTVPPQQRSWYAELLLSSSPFFSNLPRPIFDEIVSYLDWPMSLEEAKVHRDGLMKERKYFIRQNNELLFERPFSLCEH